MFIINGKLEFIEDFERFLNENKMQYSRPILTSRTEEKWTENRMGIIISDEMIRDIISIVGVTLAF